MIREGVIISERYEIIGRIGAGGMADVYKAKDHKLKRYVAVKVLKREFREDETFVKKFKTEAQAAAGLMHPNIVSVYDVGEDRGLYYFVMELVEGITLKDYIEKKGRLSVKEVISISLQVCAGIEAAHNNQIVHRDIKPQNIIISREGKVKVMDFGIAKAISSNTINTNAMGSVHYTSPEQARGGFSDAKSDIYSLGVTMYEMITGQLPFDGDSTVSIALKHLQEELVVPSQIVPEIPHSLEQIIIKCMQKSPNRRYVNMAYLARDLRRSLSDPEGDFVIIAPSLVNGHTVVRSKEEMEQIKNAQRQGGQNTPENSSVKSRTEETRQTSENKSDEVDKGMNRIILILGIAAAVLCVGALIWLIASMSSCGKPSGTGQEQSNQSQIDDSTEEQSGKVEVPSLVGKTEVEARRLCQEVNLKFEVKVYEPSEEYEDGYVVKQLIEEGTPVTEGMKVQVVVSSGLTIPVREIPDVKGKDEEEAIAALLEAGFLEDNISIELMNSADVEKEKAVGTEPEAGTELEVDKEITLYLCSGVQVVPNVVGTTKKEAKKMLKDLGLIPIFEEEYNSDYKKGSVYMQNILADTEVENGTEIICYVSLGKEQVTIPTDLTGKTKSSVEATLRNLGLDVKFQYQESYEYTEGLVIAVIDSGAKVEIGSTVTVYISTGPGPTQTLPEDTQEGVTG